MRFNLKGVIASDEDAEIYNYFGYSAVCPSDIRKAIKQNPKNEDFILEINSGGGSVYAGFEIYSILKTSNIPVIVEVQSLAGSAASVIMTAGNKVMASPVGQVMIHLPSCVSVGNQADHNESIQMLESITESIILAYIHKCGDKISSEKLREMMEHETFLTAKQALEYGLIDEIIGETSYNNIFNSATLPDIEKLREAYNKAKLPPQSSSDDSSPKGVANKRAIAIAEASLNLNFI